VYRIATDSEKQEAQLMLW